MTNVTLGLPNATPKAFVSLTGAEHNFPTTAIPTQPASAFQIAWVKRFADNDARYQPFVSWGALRAELMAGRLSIIGTESLPF